uniref:Uncharacterized protein n=1 Tax=Acrobeloides nanus TaxID=290746 RepID=A0A914EQ10_9BILA
MKQIQYYTSNFMPKSVRGLEICLTHDRSPVQFIGLTRQEEFCEQIVMAAKMAGVKIEFEDEDFNEEI